jgi:hypothetical protein
MSAHWLALLPVESCPHAHHRAYLPSYLLGLCLLSCLLAHVVSCWIAVCVPAIVPTRCRVGAMAEASLIVLRKVNHPPGAVR